MRGYLVVRAGGNRYGLRLDQVLEVVDGVEVSPAPSVHPSVRGTTEMRDTSIPLVNLASLIANCTAPNEHPQTAVLARCSGSLVALEVDDADEVGTDDPGEMPDAWRLPWVDGVVKREDTIIPIVDLDVLGERLVVPDQRECE